MYIRNPIYAHTSRIYYCAPLFQPVSINTIFHLHIYATISTSPKLSSFLTYDIRTEQPRQNSKNFGPREKKPNCHFPQQQQQQHFTTCISLLASSPPISPSQSSPTPIRCISSSSCQRLAHFPLAEPVFICQTTTTKKTTRTKNKTTKNNNNNHIRSLRYLAVASPDVPYA